MEDLEKKPSKSKTIAAAVSEEFYQEVVDFCNDRNWIISKFIYKAIRDEMKRLKNDTSKL
jgi:hypothetical protein